MLGLFASGYVPHFAGPGVPGVGAFDLGGPFVDAASPVLSESILEGEFLALLPLLARLLLA